MGHKRTQKFMANLPSQRHYTVGEYIRTVGALCNSKADKRQKIKEEIDIIGVKRIIKGIRGRMRTTDIIKDGRIDKEGYG